MSTIVDALEELERRTGLVNIYYRPDGDELAFEARPSAAALRAQALQDLIVEMHEAHKSTEIYLEIERAAADRGLIMWSDYVDTLFQFIDENVPNSRARLDAAGIEHHRYVSRYHKDWTEL